jgi:hypothetical protein
MHFVRTCYRILKANEKERINLIGMGAMRDGQGKVQATISAIRKHLDTFGKEAENHKRKSPAPYQIICNVYNLDAPVCSLQHLEDRARGDRDANPEDLQWASEYQSWTWKRV